MQASNFSVSDIPSAPHHIVPQGNPELIEFISNIAAIEWENVVKARSVELKPGGKLVAVINGADAQGKFGANGLYDALSNSFKEQLNNGTITKKEFETTKLPHFFRTEQQVLAPLSKHGFDVEDCKCIVVGNTYWEAYQESKNKEKFGADISNMVRAWSEPHMKAHLLERSEKEKHEIMEKLYSNLAKWGFSHCDDPGFGDTIVARYILLSATKLL